jgi:enoyl-CoA hydratase
LETVLCEVREGVAVLTVDRPTSRNALNLKVMEELSTALDRLEDDPSLAAIIVTGQGPKAFVAGADVAEMEKMTPETASDFSRYGQELFSRIECVPVPAIAAVNGFALGGGLELAVCCDIRIAARNARFGQPEAGLGVIPGFGGTQRLARLVGKANALDLVLTGRMVDADEALRIGLVNRVVPEGEALAQALTLAGEISAKSPFALKQAKKAILAGLSLDPPDGLLVERRLFSECFSNPDRKEGMRAFLEKRAPVYRRDGRT